MGILVVLPPLPLDAHLRRPAAGLPFPLERRGCMMFAYARHALQHGVEALGLDEGSEALVPAYHCGAEVEALVRVNVSCRFYDVTDRLEPLPTELDRLVGPRTRILYLIHYFGFPQNVGFWRRWCNERGLLLVEDAAHAWLGSHEGAPLGSRADLSVFCLHKTVGTPDGAALYVAAGHAPAPGTSVPGVARTLRNHTKWLAGRLPLPASLAAAGKPEEESVEGPPWQADRLPARLTRFLLPRLYRPAVAERRRAHFELLLDRLGHMVPSGFSRLPEGVVPYGFPVQSSAKRELRAALERSGIFPRDWLNPHPLLPTAEYPGAAATRSRLLVLPVHQELRRRDVARIADAVRALVGRPDPAPPVRRAQPRWLPRPRG